MTQKRRRFRIVRAPSVRTPEQDEARHAAYALLVSVGREARLLALACNPPPRPEPDEPVPCAT